MRRPTVTLATPLLLALTGWCPALGAQTPPTRPAAADAVGQSREAFRRGVALAQQDRWTEALEEFRRSRALADRPRTAFNVALALQRLGRYREALGPLEECLRMPSAGAEADLVDDARNLLTQVGGSLATLTLAVAPGHAEVRINDELIPGAGTLRTLAIDPGRQILDVSAPGVTPQRLEVVTRSGDRVSRRVDLAVVPARLAVTVTPPDATVSLDDEPIGHGTTAWQGSPGVHRLRVESPGYRSYRRPVSLSPGGEVRLDVALVRVGSPWYASPILWTGVGLAVAGGVLAAVLIERTAEADGGTTGRILQGYTVAW